MLILRTAPASPFGRKVKIAIATIGLLHHVQVVRADTNDANDSLRRENPLGKIPALILDDGTAVYDSRVIVDYLDSLDTRGILVPPGQRLQVLCQQALADGIMDAAILQVYERRFRPAEHQLQSWLDYQQDKVVRALAHAETEMSTPGSGAPHIGEIALASALGYLDFRFDGVWRQTYPRLVAWLDSFAARCPAFADTTPHA